MKYSSSGVYEELDALLILSVLIVSLQIIAIQYFHIIFSLLITLTIIEERDYNSVHLNLP